MRILFLDTETNGLPKNRYAPFTMTAAWPTLVQVAWEVWEFSDTQSYVKLQQASFLIQPEGEWSEEAAAIHGITQAQAEAGVSSRHALRILAEDAAECQMVVAHNLAFDKPVLLAATLRANLNPRWWPLHELCTMKATKEICKIPSTSKWAAEDPYKWPRLSELWTTLWPTRPVPTNLHNAAEDVAVLVTCFQELLRRNLLVLPIPECRFVSFFRDVLAAL